MRRLTSFSLLLLILGSLPSCQKSCKEECSSPAPCVDVGNEARKERYTRRQEPLRDVSDIKPDTDESYTAYRKRLMQTLAIQEHNISEMERYILQKRESVKGLKEQAEAVQKQNLDLKLATSTGLQAAPVNKKQDAIKRRIKESPPFLAYSVTKGDTLQKISYQHYGSSRGWLAIYRFNIDRLPDGPNTINEGQVLFLPNLQLIHTNPGQLDKSRTS